MKKIIVFLILCSNSWALKIVSTSPAITDIIFDLKQEKKLVGVSDYCQLPIKYEITRIGTALTPDFEKIYKLKADLVLINETKSRKNIKNFKKMKINFLELKFYTLSDISESYKKIAIKLNLKNKKKSLEKRIANALLEIPSFSVLEDFIIIIGIQKNKDKIKSIHIAGEKSHFNDILISSGLKNAGKGSVPYPVWDREMLIKKNPKRIFLIYPSNVKKETIELDLLSLKKLKYLTAVKNNKINFIKGDFAIIPGTKTVKLIREFAKVLR